jgi:hypothetical protein
VIIRTAASCAQRLTFDDLDALVAMHAHPEVAIFTPRPKP